MTVQIEQILRDMGMTRSQSAGITRSYAASGSIQKGKVVEVLLNGKVEQGIGKEAQQLKIFESREVSSVIPLVTSGAVFTYDLIADVPAFASIFTYGGQLIVRVFRWYENGAVRQVKESSITMPRSAAYSYYTYGYRINTKPVGNETYFFLVAGTKSQWYHTHAYIKIDIRYIPATDSFTIFFNTTDDGNQYSTYEANSSSYTSGMGADNNFCVFTSDGVVKHVGWFYHYNGTSWYYYYYGVYHRGLKAWNSMSRYIWYNTYAGQSAGGASYSDVPQSLPANWAAAYPATGNKFFSSSYGVLLFRHTDGSLQIAFIPTAGDAVATSAQLVASGGWSPNITPHLIRMGDSENYLLIYAKDKGASSFPRYDLYARTIRIYGTYSVEVYPEQKILDGGVDIAFNGRHRPLYSKYDTTVTLVALQDVATGSQKSSRQHVAIKLQINNPTGTNTSTDRTISVIGKQPLVYKNAPISVTNAIFTNSQYDLIILGSVTIDGKTTYVSGYIKNLNQDSETSSVHAGIKGVALKNAIDGEQVDVKLLLAGVDIKGVFTGLNPSGFYKIAPDGSWVETSPQDNYVAVATGTDSLRIVKEVF